jgi:hypothetical protein
VAAYEAGYLVLTSLSAVATSASAVQYLALGHDPADTLVNLHDFLFEGAGQIGSCVP